MRVWMILLGVALLSIVACSDATDEAKVDEAEAVAITGKLAPKGAKLNIVASLPSLTSIAMAIAGEHASVAMLMPAGTDPHEFQPTMRDRARLEAADILIINGLGMEMWNAASICASSKIKLIDCSQGVEESFLIHAEEHDHSHDHAHDHGEHNPHIWLCADGAAKQAKIIGDALLIADPSNGASYKRNLATLIEKLQAARDMGRLALTEHQGKAFATEHDAFPYLAREAGLEVRSMMRIPSDGLSVKRRADLEAKLQKDGVRVIFQELGALNKSAAQTVAEAVGARVGTLDPLALTDPNADSIVDVLKKNYSALAQAFAE